MSQELRRPRRTFSLSIHTQPSVPTKEEVPSPTKLGASSARIELPEINAHIPNTPRRSNFAPSGDNSPRHNANPPSPTYIFLGRKKVVDILIAENSVRESQQQKSPPSLPSTPKSSILEVKADSPRRSSFFKMSIFSPSIQSVENNHPSQTKFDEVKDELILAQKHQENLSKFNPLSPKSLINHEGYDKSEMIRRVKKHHHRIFGMDHLNLKKVRSMLTASQSNTSTPRNEELPTMLNDYHRPSMMNLEKRNSQPTLNTERLDHAELSPKIAKGFKMYEYNPLSDNFDFVDQNVQDFDIALESIVNTETGDLHITIPKKTLRGSEGGKQENIVRKAKKSHEKVVLPSLHLVRKKNPNFVERQWTEESEEGTNRLQRKDTKQDIKELIQESYGVYKNKQSDVVHADIKSLRVKELNDLCEKIEKQNKNLSKGFRRNKSGGITSDAMNKVTLRKESQKKLV